MSEMRSQIGMVLRRRLAVARALAVRTALELWRELTHLNSARIGSERLARLPRTRRIRVVKRMLAEHHRKTGHCC